VDATYPDNTALTIDEEGTPYLKRLYAQPVPEALHTLEAVLKERMPERHLLDILKISVYVTEPPPQWQHLRWAVFPAILAGGYAPLRKPLLSVLAGHLAHERGATCRASACLPPHSPPY
jgi:hypothetical protein